VCRGLQPYRVVVHLNWGAETEWRILTELAAKKKYTLMLNFTDNKLCPSKVTLVNFMFVFFGTSAREATKAESHSCVQIIERNQTTL
jgi:hypothetical protein